MGGSLQYEEILKIFSLYPQYKNIRIFVETGTYKGETARMASKHFERVYTLEISQELFQEST